MRDALARIYVIALNERKRSGSRRKPSRAVAEIIKIANAALLTDDT